MNILTYEGDEIGYPVGGRLKEAAKYIDNVFNLLWPIITNKPVNIWVRGSSGAILGTLLASKIDNEAVICHVKKEGEDSHQGNYFSNRFGEGSMDIIIDDFSCSGDTINSIHEIMIGKRTTPKRNVDVLILSGISNWNFNFFQDNWSSWITQRISKNRYR